MAVHVISIITGYFKIMQKKKVNCNNNLITERYLKT